MAGAVVAIEQVDYQYLGTDITVQPDLSENEELVEDLDCYGQDLLNSWDQPTGIADGTIEGQQWGQDVLANLSRGFTTAGLLALKVGLEVQAERDDRCEKCTVTLTASPDGSLLIVGISQTTMGPYPFSFHVKPQNVGALYVASLGTG